MKKKSKKGQGLKVKSRSPSIPPEERVPDDWKKLVPDHPDISLPDVLNNAEDTMALQVANKPSMEELINHAKSGDKKSFFDLVKINTVAHPFDNEEGSKLIIPSVSADRGFYEQEWVQKKLAKRMEETGVYVYREQFTSTSDKATRSQSIRGRMSQGKIYFPRTGWAEKIIHELMRFPVGKHDDQVDVLSLIGRMLSDMGTASDWSKPMPYMDVAVV